MNIHHIQVSDPDIELLHVHWYSPAPDDNAFIVQKEYETELSHTVMVNREEAKQLRDVLDLYLNSLSGQGSSQGETK